MPSQAAFRSESTGAAQVEAAETMCETGEQVRVNTGDPRFRERFAAAAQRREQMLNATFARAGVDVLVLRTDEDLVRAIVKFAYARKRRAGRRAAMGASA